MKSLIKNIKVPTFLFLLIITNLLHGQDLVWAKQVGSASIEYGTAITTDAVGNVFYVGTFHETTDFDPSENVYNLTSPGSSDIFISKLNESGDFLWAKQIVGDFPGASYSIDTDASGNVYITGYFESTTDFDPSDEEFILNPLNIHDAFILKLDTDGSFLWVKPFQGAGFVDGYAISIDDLGNIFTIGYFSGTADFNPEEEEYNLTANGFFDAYITKMNSSGEFLWARQLGGPGNDYGYSIDTDSDGNAYVFGVFDDALYFNGENGISDLLSDNDQDVFVCKLNDAGEFVWAKQFGSQVEDYIYSGAVDDFGNVYFAADFNGTADFDFVEESFNMTSSNGRSVFVGKLNSDGELAWMEQFVSPVGMYVSSMSMDASSNVYMTGSFYSTVDFNPNENSYELTSSGEDDVFICKLNGEGEFIWVRQMGGTSEEYGNGIYANELGDLYVIGSFYDTGDFDPSENTFNFTSNGSMDIFIHKLTQCSSTSTIDVQEACESFTWIDGVTYTSSNNTAVYMLTNAFGCDSLVTLNLTVNSIPLNTVLLSGNTLTADETEANYQWLDCNNGNEPIDGATSQSYTPTVSGNYAVIVSQNGCEETSDCTTVTVTGIDEISANEIVLFPNPAHDAVTITSSSNIHKIELMNALGQTVEVFESLYVKKYSFQLPKESGVYFVKIYTENGSISKRLVKG